MGPAICEAGDRSTARIHKDTGTRYDLCLHWGVDRNFDHVDAKQGCVWVFFRFLTRTTGKLIILADEGRTRNIDIDVILVVWIYHKRVGVRAAACLYGSDLFWTFDVRNIKYPDA